MKGNVSQAKSEQTLTGTVFKPDNQLVEGTAGIPVLGTFVLLQNADFQRVTQG
jgi:hypothetical protein